MNEASQKLYTYTAGVAAREIGTRGCRELEKGFSEFGVEVLEQEPGLYNGDEEWTLKGTKENLEAALLKWGFDTSDLEYALEEWD